MQLNARANDEGETRTGLLYWQVCRLERPIRDGVPDLMLNPSPQVSAEAEGLERFALEMRRDGWDRARVLRLPYDENGYWWTQRRSMEQLLDTITFVPGQSILDIGANICWATATFARIGLRAVALDISMVEMRGLRTADWWFEDRGTYFERVLAQMSVLPFADNTFDREVWSKAIIGGTGSTYGAPSAVRFINRYGTGLELFVEGVNHTLDFYANYDGESWSKAVIGGEGVIYGAPSAARFSDLWGTGIELFVEGANHTLDFYADYDNEPRTGAVVDGEGSVYGVPSMVRMHAPRGAFEL